MKTFFKKIKNSLTRTTSLIQTKNKGFVILYAIMLSSMLLAIALGVMNTSLKEIKFSTSAKDTNDAFFAADIGAECALFYDRLAPSGNAFTGGTSFVGPMNCGGSNLNLVGSSPSWNFNIPELGNGQGCAIVTVTKIPPITGIVSKGYNNGSGGSSPNWTCIPNASAVERQIELNY